MNLGQTPQSTGRSPYPQVWSRFDGTLRQIKPTTQFCALPGRKLVDHVLSSPSDKGLVTSYSLRLFRHRYGARHCSSLSPKESSGSFSPRPILFSPSIQYLPIWQNLPSTLSVASLHSPWPWSLRMWIVFCAIPTLPTCRCRCPPSTSWSSTSRPPRPSGSKCRLHGSPAPTR